MRVFFVYTLNTACSMDMLTKFAESFIKIILFKTCKSFINRSLCLWRLVDNWSHNRLNNFLTSILLSALLNDSRSARDMTSFEDALLTNTKTVANKNRQGQMENIFQVILPIEIRFSFTYVLVWKTDFLIYP